MLTPKHFPRPSSSRLLRDYLRDDLSSCSSSGFKSFPRRQCCTSTVHLLLDKDLKSTNTKRKLTVFSSSSARTSAPTTISAYLQKASEAVINVAKLFPLPSISSSPPLSQKIHKAKKGNILSRSLSRKLLSKSFWRRALKEEGSETRRWRWFGEELDEPLDLEQNTTAGPSGATMGLTTSSTSGSSNSWAESELTLGSSSSNYEGCAENDVVESKNDCTVKAVKKTERVGAMVGEESMDGVRTSTTTTKLDWPNEENERFSPVSVLECPFEEDDDSCLDSECSQLEGTKQNKMRKSQRLASLEPMDLEKRIALSELENETHNSPTKPAYSVSEENEIEVKARDLLNQVQRSNPSNCLLVMAENLLFDFFKQSIQENPDKAVELLKIAEEWMIGESQHVCLGREVEEGRRVYIKEMDKCCGSWRTQYSDHKEKQELALHLEFEVFTYLLNDLIVDITL